MLERNSGALGTPCEMKSYGILARFPVNFRQITKRCQRGLCGISGRSWWILGRFKVHPETARVPPMEDIRDLVKVILKCRTDRPEIPQGALKGQMSNPIDFKIIRKRRSRDLLQPLLRSHSCSIKYSSNLTIILLQICKRFPRHLPYILQVWRIFFAIYSGNYNKVSNIVTYSRVK